MLVESGQRGLPGLRKMTAAVGGDTAEISGVVTFRCWVMKNAPTVATTSTENAVSGSLLTTAPARRSGPGTRERPRVRADRGRTGPPGSNLRGTRRAPVAPRRVARPPAKPGLASADRTATLRPGSETLPGRRAR